MDFAEIKQRAGMPEVLDALGVVFNSRTKYFSCPAHGEDKHPSANFTQRKENSDRDLWTCHVCEVGGSVIDLVYLVKGIPLREAAKWICEVVLHEEFSSRDVPLRRKPLTFEEKFPVLASRGRTREHFQGTGDLPPWTEEEIRELERSFKAVEDHDARVREEISPETRKKNFQATIAYFEEFGTGTQLRDFLEMVGDNRP